MQKRFLFIFIFLILANNLSAQAISQDRSVYGSTVESLAEGPTGEKFFTGPDGVIRMYVNIWGYVTKPGTHLVYDGIDFVTLLSICGGPKQGANLGEIKLIRAESEENEPQIFEIDFNDFVDTGNKETLVSIKPGDTIIVTEKTSHMLLSHLNILNTALQVYQIYWQSQYYKSR